LKKILLFVFLFVISSSLTYSQGFIFFTDSPSSSYYDPSYGIASSPSYLELINTNKCPVDTIHFYSGTNSLRLHWISKAGGSWGMAIAADGWVGHNVNQVDSIIFMAYSDVVIDSSQLPEMYIEDLNNNKTPKEYISKYVDSIKAKTWQKISVPLSIFKNNPGSTDLTEIKTIYFGQGNSDGVEHTIYLDDIMMIKADTTPISIPTGFTATAYDSHIDLTWDASPDTNVSAYYIYKLEDSTYKRLAMVTTPDIRIYEDFVGSPGITATYKISAISIGGNESALSSPVTATTYSMTDDQLLTMLEKATFRYFWDYAHPVCGLARERLGSGNTVTIGGSGFGVMAILVGIYRNFITREQGIQRMLKILDFLSTKADRFHGAFPHWLDGNTGKVIPFSSQDDGGDLVETGFMMEGLLTARQFFNQNTTDEDSIRSMITNLWQSVDWNFYRGYPNNYALYWHWSPNYGFNGNTNFLIQGYNEAMIIYLLAVASPTHPVSKYFYSIGWAGSSYINGKSFYGYPLYVGPDYGGPLFFSQYSFLGFDPRNKKDKYTDYFINNRNMTLINRAYCIANPNHFAGYDSVTWGLTSSDGPSGYNAFSPTNDNGTIAPTAALSSMPYTPTESIAAFENFYHKYGKKIWGPFGFKDAFNVSQNWYADSYIAIDEGPIIDMVENYRSQLLWNNFMANPEIQPMLDSLGFVKDETGIKQNESVPNKFVLKGNYPNPFNPTTTIQFSLPSTQNVKLVIYDILGRRIKTLLNSNLNKGNYKVQWNGKNDFGSSVSSGVYLYTIRADNKMLSGKMILQK